MKRLKRYIQRLLLFLLKKLNMPKLFSELTTGHLSEINTGLRDMTSKFNIVNTRINPDFAVIEFWSSNDYKNGFNTNNLNNPHASINISEKFEIIIEGFDNDEKNLIKQFVGVYLKCHKFI